MVRREMSSCDAAKLFIGCFTSLVVGAALPGFSLVFGNMIDEVADTSSADGGEDEFNSLQK